MNDEQAKIQQELSEIQTELNTKGMSRRNFLDRLKGVGIGFGAVAVVGTTAAQAHTNEGSVGLKTTNAALGKVVEDSQQEAAEVEGEHNQQEAQYYYRRRYFYRPRYFYRRYRRFFYRRFFYRRRYFY